MSDPVEPILQFFEYSHLRPDLQAVSKPFCDLAHNSIGALPRNPERTVMLRKLLEAKDCAVRAFLYVSATTGLAFLLGFLAWTFPTFAADLAYKVPPPAYGIASWQGLYLSAYGLYGANLTNTTVTDSAGVSVDLASAPHGPGIGGSIGYYFQPTPNGIVFGPRVDLAYANMQGGGSFANALSVSNATNYLGDVDLIVGLPLSPDGRFLGYLGAGFAFGGAKPNLQVVNLQQAAADTSTGWNAVAGLAYQIAPNWQLFIEGNYYQLGDKSLSVMDGNVLLATSDTKYHLFTQKFGLTWKFP